MSLRQPVLDPLLLGEQPVERLIDLGNRDLAEFEAVARARGGGLGLSARTIASLEAGAITRLTMSARTRSR